MLKKGKTILTLLATSSILSLATTPLTGHAASLDEIKQESASKQAELDQLSNDLNTAMTEINQVNDQLKELEKEVADTQTAISETSLAVEEKEAEATEKTEQAKARLQAIQANDTHASVFLTLMQAESLSDFFERAYVLATIQAEGNRQIEEAVTTAQELGQLKADLVAEEDKLIANQKAAGLQKDLLDGKVANIQSFIHENQVALAQLADQEAAEQARLIQASLEEETVEANQVAENDQGQETAKAERAVASQTAEKPSQNKASQVVTEKSSESEAPKQTAAQPLEKISQKSVSDSKPAAEKKAPAPAPAPAKPAPSGRTVNVVATAYSTNQPSLSTHTATGIDLRSNPHVIAVDPSVIPLGSMVEVPGYGIRIAGDTGGAIKGNRIDIHITDLGTARAFGYQNMTVRILN